MSKPTTNYGRPSKSSTNTASRQGTLHEYGDLLVLDGSEQYEPGAYPIITNTTPQARSSTNSSGNPTYDAARTTYNAHLLYNAHIYYIGRDPNLIPGSERQRLNTSKPTKASTSYH